MLKQQRNSRDGEIYCPNKLRKFVHKVEKSPELAEEDEPKLRLPQPKKMLNLDLSQSVNNKQKFIEILKVLQNHKMRRNASFESYSRSKILPYGGDTSFMKTEKKSENVKNLKYSRNLQNRISASHSFSRKLDQSSTIKFSKSRIGSLQETAKVLDYGDSNLYKSFDQNKSVSLPTKGKSRNFSKSKDRYFEYSFGKSFFQSKTVDDSNSLFKKDKNLDLEIKEMTKGNTNTEDVVGIDLKDLFDKYPIVIISKFQKRLECIQELKPAHAKISIAQDMKFFHLECQTWLKRAISSRGKFSPEFLNEMKFTESGDMFKGEHNGQEPNGLGLCLTRKNQLIQARYKSGVIQSGFCRILYPNGEYYEGSVKKGGIRHGAGRHFYQNGDVYDGGFVNNLRVGKSRMILSDGAEYIGQFIQDDADGHGIFTDKDGNRYMSIASEEEVQGTSEHESQANKKDTKSGYFYRLRLYGKGEIKFKNGNTYLGQFKGGKREGYGEMSFITPPDEFPSDIGDYKGQFKRDKRDGEGTMVYADGSTFEGEFRNDQKYKGIYKSPSGEQYEGKFQNNLYNGLGKLTFLGGTVIEGKFESGNLGETGKIIKDGPGGKCKSTS